MSKFKDWLLASPIDDAFFFTNIRKLARAIHLRRGHRWVYNTAVATIGVGDVICEIKFRRCIDCDLKETTNEKGEVTTIIVMEALLSVLWDNQRSPAPCYHNPSEIEWLEIPELTAIEQEISDENEEDSEENEEENALEEAPESESV